MTDILDWKRMMFKGHKVWLALDGHQRPVVKNRKVLIKYQLGQNHQYWVPEKAVQAIEPGCLQKRASVGQPDLDRAPSRSPRDDAVEPGSIVVHTDGASSGNPGPAGIGVVLRFQERQKEISRHIGTATNNVAELMAIKTALEAIRTSDIPVRLFTDSQYCYGLLVLGWKARQNGALVAATKKLITKFKDIEIRKIEGHAGITDNERADRLARAAANTGPRGTKVPPRRG